LGFCLSTLLGVGLFLIWREVSPREYRFKSKILLGQTVEIKMLKGFRDTKIVPLADEDHIREVLKATVGLNQARSNLGYVSQLILGDDGEGPLAHIETRGVDEASARAVFQKAFEAVKNVYGSDYEQILKEKKERLVHVNEEIKRIDQGMNSIKKNLGSGRKDDLVLAAQLQNIYYEDKKDELRSEQEALEFILSPVHTHDFQILSNSDSGEFVRFNVRPMAIFSFLFSIWSLWLLSVVYKNREKVFFYFDSRNEKVAEQ